MSAFERELRERAGAQYPSASRIPEQAARIEAKIQRVLPKHRQTEQRQAIIARADGPSGIG